MWDPAAIVSNIAPPSYADRPEGYQRRRPTGPAPLRRVEAGEGATAAG